MQANLKAGFRRICLFAYSCWMAGWLFWFYAYAPFESAVAMQDIDSKAADFYFSQCKDKVNAIQARLESDRAISEMVQRNFGKPATAGKESGSLVEAPYGTDVGGHALSKDQALNACDSGRRRASDAFKRTPFFFYLKMEYRNRLSPIEGGITLTYVFLLPVVVYYCLLGITWAGLRTYSWIKSGFQGVDGAGPPH